MTKNQRLAYSFFHKKGLTPIQAAAIVGNLVHESGSIHLDTRAINPNDAGAGKHSMGIAQWNRARLEGLQNFAKNNRGTDMYDFQTQLEYTWHELTTTHKPALERLQKATNLVEATHIFNRHFEGSQDSLGGMDEKLVQARQNRLAHASKLLQSQGYDHTIVPSKYSGKHTMFIEGVSPEQYMRQQQESRPEDFEILDFWDLLTYQPEFESEDDENDDYYNDMMLARLISESTKEYNETPTTIDEKENDADTLSAYNSLQDQNDYNEMMLKLIMSAQYPIIDRTPQT